MTGKQFDELGPEELEKITGNTGNREGDLIDDIMASFIIETKEDYDSCRAEIETFAQAQHRKYERHRLCYSLKPHDHERKKALENVALCAEALDTALSELVYGYFHSDLTNLGKRLKKELLKNKIILSDELIETTINRDFKKKYFKRYNEDGVKKPRFAYKKMGISKLLKSTAKVARKVKISGKAIELDKRTGGPIVDKFNHKLKDRCLDLFKRHTATMTAKEEKEKFSEFKDDMYLKIFGQKEYPLDKIRAVRKSKKTN